MTLHQVRWNAEVLIESIVLMIVTLYILILEFIPLISTLRIRKFWLLCVAGIYTRDFEFFNSYIFVFTIFTPLALSFVFTSSFRA